MAVASTPSFFPSCDGLFPCLQSPTLGILAVAPSSFSLAWKYAAIKSTPKTIHLFFVQQLHTSMPTERKSMAGEYSSMLNEPALSKVRIFLFCDYYLFILSSFSVSTLKVDVHFLLFVNASSTKAAFGSFDSKFVEN